MYLSKLELVGFKSFAQKILFNFTEGISAIVGPNGCGKTNVVDAIRWALGEQKTAVLRSDLMENVIFNGTRSRKPLGMAEVSLTLQNNKGKLPLEYTEVTITRRLFRNGESQYLLNNTQCRLRDIVDLFMDTGLGANSYSVIELKMVEAILSGKPEERRNLLEEAAGVVRYKVRRKEASKKLLDVQDDLLRVEDIIVEVRKLVNSLNRQAIKTKRYNDLLEHLKQTDLEVLKYHFLTQNSLLLDREEQIAKVKTDKENKEVGLNAAEANLNELEKKQSQIEKEYMLARDKESELNADIAQKSKDIAVLQEKVLSLRDKQRRINIDLENLKIEIENTTQNLDDTSKNRELVKIALENNIEELAESNDKKAQASKKVDALRENANVNNRQIIALENKLNSLKQGEKKLTERKTSIEKKIVADAENIVSLKKDILNLEYNLQEKSIAETKLGDEIIEIENRLKTAQERQESLQMKLDEIRNLISDAEREYNSKKSSLELLTGLIDSDETTKYLLKEQKWAPAGEKSLLSELAGVDESYRLAINAALGEATQYFVVDKRSDADYAIALLQASDKGKATFLCRDSIPNIPKPVDAPCQDGYSGWASELIRVDETIRSAVRAIAPRTLVVKDFALALQAVESGVTETAVTLKGELISKVGLYRGGSVTKTEGRTIGKKERIQKLKVEIDALDKKLGIQRDNFNQIKNELSEININSINAELRSKEAEKNSFVQELSRLKYRRESIENNINLLEKNNKGLSDEIETIEKDMVVGNEEMVKISSDLAIFRNELQHTKNDLAQAGKIYEQIADASRKLELQSVRLKSEAENLEKDILRLENIKQNAINKIENESIEFQKAEGDIVVLVKMIDSYIVELERIKKENEEATAKRKYLAEQLDSLQEQLQSYSDDLKRLREAYSATVDNLHKYELQLSEHSTQRRHIVAKAQEKYTVDFEKETVALEESFSIDAATTLLNNIKDKLASLGNVNFLALEEYEKEKERLEFYENQMKDLSDSEKNLQETIEEINRNAEQQFLTTFEEINKNFQTLFKTLFGDEGEANLQLAEGNLLESDIEIMAKPPGKRPHIIEMLSGGEKTLIAIALLFAIYLVKPSPFCILDEVDAPLDDNNIDKFLQLIRRFSVETQFLIVTHNKRSMSAADTLYGITMQEEGVSKVVSARLAGIDV